MTTKQLPRFWKTLDEIPDAATDRREWSLLLGEEWPAAAGYLTSTGRVARAIACPSPGGDGCPRRVVRHAGGTRAVCGNSPAECEAVDLSLDDLAILALDRAKLARSICSVLNIEMDRHDDGPVIHLGRHRVAAGLDIPALLVIPGPIMDPAAVLSMEPQTEARVIVTPTRHSLPRAVRDALEAKGHLILPISEIAAYEGGSGLVGVEPAECLLAPLRDKLLASRKAVSSLRLWTLPPGAQWEDLQFELISEEVINVRHGSETRRFEPEDFGMKKRTNGRPTVAWTLLQVLAGANGRLTWADRRASKRVPKQKQLLGQSLKEVFGLSDDPIPWRDGDKAYVTRFRIRDSRPERAPARRGDRQLRRSTSGSSHRQRLRSLH